MKPTPILFVSDSPSLPTGLGRITKDLAVLTSNMPQFRVATMGLGGNFSSKLPFAQYSVDPVRQWGEGQLEGIWNDFAGPEQGIIFTIWDASRLTWFANPKMGGQLQEFISSGKFTRWGYFPVDSYGVGGRLTGQVRDVLNAYDRVLAYTIFGKQIIEQTIGKEVDWIPHGFNEKIFQPRDRVAGRMALGFDSTDVVVGMVATNQARKDWGTAFGAIAYLKNKIKNLKFWVHTDVLINEWNILALVEDFGLADSVKITYSGDFTSEQLSYAYSACDCTMLISLGEGFGFPIIESMACGIPVIHPNWGGGAELIPDKLWLVPASGERLEGPWNMIRPVLDPREAAARLENVLDEARGGSLKDSCLNAVEHLQWKNLWPSCWQKWMLKGVNQ